MCATGTEVKKKSAEPLRATEKLPRATSRKTNYQLSAFRHWPGPRQYGTPPTIVATNVSGLATHRAGTCSCTKPHIPLQVRGCVCTSTGNRSVWLSSLASKYPPEFCRKFAQSVGWRTNERSRPCMAMESGRAGGDHPASRASLMSASMPGHSIGWEFAVDVRLHRNAPAWARVADGKRARGHDLVTSELNVLLFGKHKKAATHIPSSDTQMVI